ncbi:putative dehydrogenase [Microlunatus panaciterrae]|uniref:Dehydrogenase n=1 Tax=Microlunatus panaciterrae TaxID=400768 RepID=A0ABS2RGW0_9ACTN|nr:putative dehydrogenase [Microlunatus panaciterrae]
MTSNDQRRIGWGILSTGHMATVIAQDLALLSDEAALVAVGSRELSKAEDFAATYGVPAAYGSYAELAADPAVDVVYIASPHNDHYPSAKLCLEAGKSVLVEKPLTVTDAEAEELVALAQDRDLFLMEALWSRTNPLLRKAAELVGSGELGPVKHVAASFGFAFDGDDSHRLLNPDLAGGAILDLGVYPVHGVNLFLGEPDAVLGYGSLASTGVDAHAAAVLSYPATDQRPAATATVLCTLETTPPTRLEVFCTGGRVVIDFFIKPESIEVFRGTGHDVEPEVMITQLPGLGYTFQLQEVNRALRAGENESPLVPWADTLATMRTLSRWRTAVEAAAAADRES